MQPILGVHGRFALRRGRPAQGTPRDDTLGVASTLAVFWRDRNERVVVDGAWVFAAGVTAGIDGALRRAAELRGDAAAQAIQLYMAYAPEPPFNSGSPETAPTEVLRLARQSMRAITTQREQTARRAAARLGIAVAIAGGT